jgi:formylglycine-generating enzyme required for sulfatase activity
MAGNAREWTNDWYSESYYLRKDKDNPLGAKSGQFRAV